MYENIANINWSKCYITTTSSFMRDICQCLQNLGIYHFSHISIYSDDSFSVLTSYPEFSELYVKSKFYKIALAGSYHQYQPGYILTNSISNQTIFKALAESTGFGNGLVITKKSQEKCDFFHFYAKVENKAIELLYLNQIDFFEKFINYYCSTAETIIAEANNNRFVYPISAIETTEFSITNRQITDVNHILSELNLANKNADLTTIVPLTHKEQQALHLLLQGYTSKEIAKMLHRSPRTIEKHIAQLRKKYCVQSIPKLICKFAKSPTIFKSHT